MKELQCKREVQKQWDGDPCGANTVQDSQPGTLEYYRKIRNHRYEVYGPWFNDTVQFSDWVNSDILEIGVGLGSDHYRFARNGNRMTALDLSREHLRLTQEHLKLEGLSNVPIFGDAENMPFEDESFDLVYSFGVLHHTPNTQKAFQEVYRVLRPGGKAIIGLYHKHSIFYWIQTILTNGLIRGLLFTKGFWGLMSEIEHRENLDSATPLVKVYSRHKCKKMYSQFRECKLSTCHVESQHFGYASRAARWMSRHTLEKLFGRWGWYVVARVVK